MLGVAGWDSRSLGKVGRVGAGDQMLLTAQRKPGGGTVSHSQVDKIHVSVPLDLITLIPNGDGLPQLWSSANWAGLSS